MYEVRSVATTYGETSNLTLAIIKLYAMKLGQCFLKKARVELLKSTRHVGALLE